MTKEPIEEVRPDKLTANEAIELVLKRPGMYGLVPKAEHRSMKAERDAALAAIERVRAIHKPDSVVDGTCSECSDYGTDEHPVWLSIMWPCPTVAALDGAPEPEWEYVIINGLGRGIYTAPTLAEARKQVAIDQSGEGPVPIRTIQRRRKAGPWLPVEGESKP